MEIRIRAWGFRLSLDVSLPDWLTASDDDERSIALHTGSDLEFGFTADPVFPDIEWDEEEDKRAGA